MGALELGSASPSRILFSAAGKKALALVQSHVRPIAKDEVDALALRFFGQDRASAYQELSALSGELFVATKELNPEIKDHVLNGLIIGFCELVCDRLDEFDRAAAATAGAAS